MIQIEESIIRKIILNRVADEYTSIVSDTLFDFTEGEEESVLKKLFLKPFTSQVQTFEFTHSVNIEYNVLYNLCRNIYNGKDFIKQAKDITQHLVASSTHPNINDGDLFIVAFDGIKLQDTLYDAVGIYKYEDKDSFLETTVADKKISLAFKQGIGNKKPEKACLVLFTPEPYTLFIVDGSNNETEYWQNDFINNQPKNDFINNTTDFLQLTRSFIAEHIPTEFDISRADQIDLLNRSVGYFKSNEHFNKQEFEEAVFQHPNVIQSFRDFDESYRKENALERNDSFDISPQAVKKQARIFKSVLKLDRNFHIYIHGNRDLIEQGIDDKGRKFYKIYYDLES